MKKRELQIESDSSVVTVSNVVDKLEPAINPTDAGYYPLTQSELSRALAEMAKEVPDDSIRTFYHSVLDLVNNFRDVESESPEREPEMTLKKNSDAKKIEETLRGVVRKMLIEMNEASETDRMHNQGRSVDGPLFKEIGAELGVKASHAKGLFTRFIDKAQWLQRKYEENPEQFEEWVTDAVYDYIEELKEMEHLPGEPEGDQLTPEDIKLLADNPEMVMELPSFRVYFSKYIKKAGWVSPYSSKE